MKLKDLTLPELEQAESFYKEKLAEMEQFRKTITAKALSPKLKEKMEKYENLYGKHLDDIIDEHARKTCLKQVMKVKRPSQ